MPQRERIEGFSGFTARKQTDWMASQVGNAGNFLKTLKEHQHPSSALQELYAGFSENTLSNYFLPYSIAPNFLINHTIYHVPMVIEESSVVAAAAAAAKFWYNRGGFHCEVKNTVKKGQVHFEWFGQAEHLKRYFSVFKDEILNYLSPLTTSMKKRGGGILDITLLHKPEVLPNYYQLDVSFDTVDAMGANFINSCLEEIAHFLKQKIETGGFFNSNERECNIIMAILSNYTTDCLVSCELRSNIDALKQIKQKMEGLEFARKFEKAIHIAQNDISRAVTQNKGIANGLDAVLLATGNDFRSVEACLHAWAARTGTYKSLSEVTVTDTEFVLRMEIPLALGTIGGLTNLHPMAAQSLELLGHPTARDLMMITASVGLANNFSAVRALISGGIQQGHMRMHLSNILNLLGANESEKKHAEEWFEGKTISHSLVENFINHFKENP